MSMIFPIITEEVTRLPVYVTGVGIKYSQERKERPDGFRCYHWLQSVQGCGKLVVGGNEFIISEGMAFFLYPGVPHEYYPLCEQWITKWVIFDGKMLPELLHIMEVKSWGIYDMNDNQQVSQLFDEIYKTLHKENPYKHITCSALLYNFLVSSFCYTHPSSSDIKLAKHKKLLPVIALMEKNIHLDLALEDMAREINVTTSYLCRLFSQAYNTTPFKYFNQMKIQKAKSLLMEVPQLSINDISRQVGYNSPSYFCSIFKSIEGCTPMEFRNLHGNI